ncbi:hypothetical protein E4U11_004285, partial [Claviceps purpurea]
GIEVVHKRVGIPSAGLSGLEVMSEALLDGIRETVLDKNPALAGGKGGGEGRRSRSSAVFDGDALAAELGRRPVE